MSSFNRAPRSSTGADKQGGGRKKKVGCCLPSTLAIYDKSINVRKNNSRSPPILRGIANFSKHFVTFRARYRTGPCEQTRRARKMTKNTVNIVIHPAESIDSSDSVARRKIRRSSRLVATAVQKRNRPSRVRRREEGTERYCAALSRPENKSSSLSNDNKVNTLLARIFENRRR